MNLLKIRLRKSAVGSCYLTIINQRTLPNIEVGTYGNNYSIKISQHPEVVENSIYLRGSSEELNFKELKLIKIKRTNLINALLDYANKMNYKFSIENINNKFIDINIGTNNNGVTTPGNVISKIISSANTAKTIVESYLSTLILTDYITVDDLINVPNSIIDINQNFSLLPKQPKIIPSIVLAMCKICKQSTSISKMKFNDCCITCYEKVQKCDFCGCFDSKSHPQGAPLNKVKDETNNKTLTLCPSCSPTTTCSHCKKVGIIKGFNGVLQINEEGKDIKTKNTHCSACILNHKNCGHCGNYFDPTIYKKCPCRLPKTFKGHIYPYNENVLNHLPMDEGCKELYGLEIEVGVSVKYRPEYLDVLTHSFELVKDDAIILYDSSIDYINKNEGIENVFKGFEIVTRPLTYKNMNKFIRNLSKNRNSLLRSWEVGTTGVHIHVSKQYLSNMDIGKMLVFTSDKKNRKFIKMIAKREDAKYAKFVPRTLADFNDSSPECHYYAINTNKPNTIEIRIFRGTLNENTLISYLQFVKSLIEYVKTNNVSDLSYVNYLEWLIPQTSEYPELIERIRNENFDVIEEAGQI